MILPKALILIALVDLARGQLYKNTPRYQSVQCESSQIYYAGKCQATKPTLIPQSSLMEELYSPNGQDFLTVDTYHVSFTVMDTVFGQLIRPRAGMKIWVSHDVVDSTEIQPEEVIMSTNNGRIIRRPFITNETLEFVSNSMGVISFGLVANQRLGGIPALRVHADFMQPFEYLYLQPNFAVLSGFHEGSNGTGALGAFNQKMSVMLELMASDLHEEVHRSDLHKRDIEEDSDMIMSGFGLHNHKNDQLYAPRMSSSLLSKRDSSPMYSSPNSPMTTVADKPSFKNSALQKLSEKFHTFIKAVERAIKATGIKFSQVWSRLRSAFSWDDIANSHHILVTHVLQVIPALENMVLMGSKDILSSVNATKVRKMEGMENMIRRINGKTTKEHRASGLTIKRIEENYVGNMVANHWNGQLPEIAAVNVTLPEWFNEQLESSAFVSEFEKISKDATLLKKIQSAFANIAKDAATGLIEIMQTFWSIGFHLLEAFTEIGFAVLKATLNIVEKLFTMHINIPIITRFYETYISKGQHKLCFVSLLGLIGAAPYTVVYKLANGRAPFSKDFMTRFDTMKPLDFINLITGEPTSVAKLGGDMGFQLYFGYFKIALSSIDLVAAHIIKASSGVLFDLYWLFFDLLFVPIIPMALPGPAHGIAGPAWSLFIFSVMTDFFFAFNQFISVARLPNLFTLGSLGHSAATSLVGYGKFQLWHWFRGGTMLGILAFLYEALFEYVHKEIPNPKAQRFLYAAFVTDIMGILFGLGTSLIPDSSLVGLPLLPGVGAVRMIFRYNANFWRIVSAVLQVKGAQIPKFVTEEL